MSIDQPQPTNSQRMEVSNFFADYLHHRVTTPVEHQGKADRPSATGAGADRAPKTPGSEGPYTLADGRVALPAMSITSKEQKQLQDTVLNFKASAEERLTAVKKLSEQGVKSLDLNRRQRPHQQSPTGSK